MAGIADALLAFTAGMGRGLVARKEYHLEERREAEEKKYREEQKKLIQAQTVTMQEQVEKSRLERKATEKIVGELATKNLGSLGAKKLFSLSLSAMQAGAGELGKYLYKMQEQISTEEEKKVNRDFINDYLKSTGITVPPGVDPEILSKLVKLREEGDPETLAVKKGKFVTDFLNAREELRQKIIMGPLQEKKITGEIGYEETMRPLRKEEIKAKIQKLIKEPEEKLRPGFKMTDVEQSLNQKLKAKTETRSTEEILMGEEKYLTTKDIDDVFEPYFQQLEQFKDIRGKLTKEGEYLRRNLIDRKNRELKNIGGSNLKEQIDTALKEAQDKKGDRPLTREDINIALAPLEAMIKGLQKGPLTDDRDRMILKYLLSIYQGAKE